MVMHLPNPRLLGQLQGRVRSGFYTDSAVLIKEIGSGTYDENNTEIVTLQEIPLDCSFSEKGSSETWSDYADIGQVDADIRFEGHDPQKGDTVRVGNRFDNTSHDYKTYEVVGILNRFTFGYVCALRKVAV